MKLIARKSMVAMGTAFAMALTPVAVPSMAPTAFAVSDSNFAARYGAVNSKITALTELLKGKDKDIQTTRSAVSGVTEAVNKVNQAETELKIAQGLLGDAERYRDSVVGDNGKPNVNDENYGTLDSAIKALNDANTAASRVDTRLGEARAEKQKAEDKVFKCEGAKENSNSSDDLSSGGISGIFNSSGSSGNMITYKDGKKRCVSKSEYYTDKLTKIVAVLGTIFTLMTTLTKISDVMMKNNPAALPAPAK